MREGKFNLIIINNFYFNNLPFTLTDAQKRVMKEIRKDLGSGKQMNRLLQGDVGSGKTLVACLVMLNVALNKKQAVLMVPTEILARQHFRTITKLFANYNIKIGLITRSDKRINYESGIMNHEYEPPPFSSLPLAAGRGGGNS